MNRTLLLFLPVLIGCSLHPALGQDEEFTADQLRQKAMCFAIRYGIKAYITASDFQKIKKTAMADIAKTPDANFASEYARSWPTLQKCPKIVAKYGLRRKMTKNQVLSIISRLQPEDCCAAVDDVSDEVIIEQYNKCLNSPEMQDKSLAEQINIIMGRYLRGNGK